MTPSTPLSRVGFPIHELKVDEPYFDALRSGHKNFEVRYNDRNFQPQDLLRLREWTGSGYTDRETLREITYVLRDGERFGLKDGYVVLALRPAKLVVAS